MPHLAQVRPGWENEHLASYILSRIAFIARPATVADDLGSDLFCTLFDVTEKDGREYLVPHNTIAVQVKSSAGIIDVTRNIEYLGSLEVPYYVGVVNRVDLALTLYSGRYLPLMFSYRGSPIRLRLILTDHAEEAYQGSDEAGYDVFCPRLAVLRAAEERKDLRAAARVLRKDSVDALGAVVSRLNNEFIFDGPTGVHILAGPRSALVFRDNFFRRLAEAFRNFTWLCRSGQKTDSAELEAFLKAFAAFENREIPPFLTKAKDELQQTLRGST
jgi:hypothetical protein